jgi:hypothetical protein
MPIPSDYEANGSDSSLFKMTGVGMPPYATRGITQTLAHIGGAAQIHRTINGDLADFSFDQFRKYVSTVSATDQRPPALDGVWPGLEVTVECAHALAYLTAGGAPARTPVPDSSFTEGAYTFYRPILQMRITGFDGSFDEWQAGESWSITLEEI